MSKQTYTVVICPYCRQQARWDKLDRISYCYQCGNPEHGHKYLSHPDKKFENSAIVIKTVEVIK
jgi:predicted amidophosphoribosyltransferase